MLRFIDILIWFYWILHQKLLHLNQYYCPAYDWCTYSKAKKETMPFNSGSQFRTFSESKRLVGPPLYAVLKTAASPSSYLHTKLSSIYKSSMPPITPSIFYTLTLTFRKILPNFETKYSRFSPTEYVKYFPKNRHICFAQVLEPTKAFQNCKVLHRNFILRCFQTFRISFLHLAVQLIILQPPLHNAVIQKHVTVYSHQSLS